MPKEIESIETTKKSSQQFPKEWKTSKDLSIENIIGNIGKGVSTRRSIKNICNTMAFVSQVEPKTIDEALHDENWLMAMQEELNQFERMKFLSQILWMKQKLKDYGTELNKIPLRCDNTSAINLTKNPILHSRTKHIEIRHHFLRDHVQKNDCCSYQFVETNKQLADIFTKSLPKERFNQLRIELGIINESCLN
uniref:Copia protein n=1 Tax=Cajanus cajan TaxID=3821 RepID=A0A151QYX9_CAJCA|nr:Copia protein [Cajanus cajan]